MVTCIAQDNLVSAYSRAGIPAHCAPSSSVNQPTPAIVTQNAASPMPRWALLLLCLAYVVPGYVGRDPWKNTDITAYGYMLEIAQGRTAWISPLLGGMPPETDGPLPYWLGALALQWAPSWLAPELAARVPFMALLVLTLIATWYGVYYLARSPGAQPVAFAFGGEARPSDYARAMADGGLLALIACLGLAQLSHEITSYLTQLACTTLVFFAAAVMPYRAWAAAIAMPLGLGGLVLAGAPSLAALFGLGAAAIALYAPAKFSDRRRAWALAWLGAVAASALVGWAMDLWEWRLVAPTALEPYLDSTLRLLIWFGWPAWPLALWSLWSWRHLIASRRQRHRHLLLPLWFIVVTVGATLTTQPADRALLLGLPALATLSAFALPTLKRSIAALIDWFTLLFFTISAITIWVIWLSLQTGIPPQPATNIARLAPGFTPSFSAFTLPVALAATGGWCTLVWWRASRHRAAIWKSLVLPASGATLGWLLLMTLWLPMLDYARSYRPQVERIVAALGPAPGCILTHGLSHPQVAALQHHGQLDLRPDITEPLPNCRWMAVSSEADAPAAALKQPELWQLYATIPRPTDKNERIQLLRRMD
jgi:4-amino-4-deoxy-L-arabinose transferase-like glycosyltransferase